MNKELLASYRYLFNYYKEQYDKASNDRLKKEYKSRILKTQMDISNLKSLNT